MYNHKIHYVFFISLMAVSNLYAQASEYEIYTLFTTQQERELINKNRYKKQKVKAPVVVDEKPQQQEKEEVELEKITLTIKLAGVTLSQSGQNIAWINGKAFENGHQLDDGSKVYINVKVKNLVQLKTPDGKYHSIVTGETAEISYFKRIEG